MKALAGVSAALYITIYAVESPLRYLLHRAHASPAILARDLLIIAPLTLLGLAGLLGEKLHPAFWLAAVFIGIGAAVSVMNFGAAGPAALGTKMLLNVLFGLVAGAGLIRPGPRTARLLLALWAVTVLGLVLEKYVMVFPWVGVRTEIGGLQVEISRNWQIGDASAQRIGGFTKESISAAGLLPELALVAMARNRLLPRLALVAISLGAVYLTTQKGALVAFFLVSLAFCIPSALRVPALGLLVLGAVALEIALPLATSGLHLAEGHGGVFSFSSFAQRIDDTWPNSLGWIADHELFPFGTGIGGIGRSQALLGSIAQHYPDNLFLLLYAFFGLPCLILLGWVVHAAMRSAVIDPAMAEPALAVLAFNLLYGSVVSIVEDQAGALFLGSALGILLWAPRVISRPAIRVQAAPLVQA